ncbi:hypothetical protein [Paracidovorax citrulli]
MQTNIAPAGAIINSAEQAVPLEPLATAPGAQSEASPLVSEHVIDIDSPFHRCLFACFSAAPRRAAALFSCSVVSSIVGAGVVTYLATGSTAWAEVAVMATSSVVVCGLVLVCRLPLNDR